MKKVQRRKLLLKSSLSLGCWLTVYSTYLGKGMQDNGCLVIYVRIDLYEQRQANASKIYTAPHNTGMSTRKARGVVTKERKQAVIREQ